VKTSVEALSLDIEACLQDEHETLREGMLSLKADDAGKILPKLRNLFQAEGEVLLARAMELDLLRADALRALETQELAQFMIERAKQGADEEQISARNRMLADLAEWYFKILENDLLPKIRSQLSPDERQELTLRYLEAKNRYELAPSFQLPNQEFANLEAGRMELVLAWLIGLPIWVFLMIFVIHRV
jgi:hypothetical protein